MRLSLVLLSLLVGSITSLAVLMLLLPAPNYYFFALGVAALEWAPLILLFGGLSGLLALVGLRGTPTLTRILSWIALACASWTILAGTGVVIATLQRSLVVRSTMPAMSEIEPGRFSLATFLRGMPAGHGITIQRDQVYATVNQRQLTFDHYAPASSASLAPAIIVVHGGSWRSGGKGEFGPANLALVEQGYHIFDVEYRLAPDDPFPAALSDIQCAIGAIKQQATRFGIDPQRIALLGRSAGAQIVLLAAYTADQPDFPIHCTAADTSVAAVIAYYPPTDLSYDYVNKILPELTTGALDSYLGGGPEQQPEAYRLATPLNWIGPHTPPTLLLHGERDQYVRLRDSQVLAERLAQAARPFTLVEIPRANHGFDANLVGLSNQRIQPYLDRFLATTLQK